MPVETDTIDLPGIRGESGRSAPSAQAGGPAVSLRRAASRKDDTHRRSAPSIAPTCYDGTVSPWRLSASGVLLRSVWHVPFASPRHDRNRMAAGCRAKLDFARRVDGRPCLVRPSLSSSGQASQCRAWSGPGLREPRARFRGALATRFERRRSVDQDCAIALHSASRRTRFPALAGGQPAVRRPDRAGVDHRRKWPSEAEQHRHSVISKGEPQRPRAFQGAPRREGR